MLYQPAPANTDHAPLTVIDGPAKPQTDRAETRPEQTETKASCTGTTGSGGS